MANSKREILIGAVATAYAAAGNARAGNAQSRPRAYTLPNGEAVMNLLAGTSFVTFGTGENIVYEVSFRACGPCISFARSGSRDLVRAGFQVRSFIFAPKTTSGRGSAGEGEIATVAEIYRTRDAALFEAFYRANNIEGFARSRGIPDLASDDPGRLSTKEGSAKVKALGALIEQTQVGKNWGFPAFIWRSPNGVQAKFGYGGARDLLSILRRG